MLNVGPVRLRSASLRSGPTAERWSAPIPNQSLACRAEALAEVGHLSPITILAPRQSEAATAKNSQLRVRHSSLSSLRCPHEASIHTRRRRSLRISRAQPPTQRKMVQARSGIAQRVRIRKWRRRWQRQRHHRIAQRQTGATNDRSHVIPPAQHVDLAKSARASEETQSRSRGSGPMHGRRWS